MDEAPQQVEDAAPAVDPQQVEDAAAAVEPQQVEDAAPAVEPQQVEDAAPVVEPRRVEGQGAGTGRRKESVARVRLTPGTGQFRLNGRAVESYFPSRAHRMEISAPLRIVGLEKDLDVWARLDGGGVSGQAGALRHGIARALVEFDPSLRPALKREGYLRRDSREKERRKYGLKKARKAPQYSKR